VREQQVGGKEMSRSERHVARPSRRREPGVGKLYRGEIVDRFSAESAEGVDEAEVEGKGDQTR
jgi:hypothetical protein